MANEQNTQQTPEQLKAAQEKAAQEKVAQEKAAAEKAAKEKAAKKEVDPETYQKYIAKKFVELSGAKLKDAVKKEMADLEKELKACSGDVPVITVSAHVSNELLKLVKGVPIPKSYSEIIKASKKPAYYLGE